MMKKRDEAKASAPIRSMYERYGYFEKNRFSRNRSVFCGDCQFFVRLRQRQLRRCMKYREMGWKTFWEESYDACGLFEAAKSLDVPHPAKDARLSVYQEAIELFELRFGKVEDREKD